MKIKVFFIVTVVYSLAVVILCYCSETNSYFIHPYAISVKSSQSVAKVDPNNPRTIRELLVGYEYWRIAINYPSAESYIFREDGTLYCNKKIEKMTLPGYGGSYPFHWELNGEVLTIKNNNYKVINTYMVERVEKDGSIYLKLKSLSNNMIIVWAAKYGIR